MTGKGALVALVVGAGGILALSGIASAAPKKSSTPSSAPGGRPTLRRGSTGASVGELQTRLNSWGSFGLKVDNIFGEKTEAAVRNFQNSAADPKTGQPLVVDGIVGPKTWSALLLTT